MKGDLWARLLDLSVIEWRLWADKCIRAALAHALGKWCHALAMASADLWLTPLYALVDKCSQAQSVLLTAFLWSALRFRQSADMCNRATLARALGHISAQLSRSHTQTHKTFHQSIFRVKMTNCDHHELLSSIDFRTYCIKSPKFDE